MAGFALIGAGWYNVAGDAIYSRQFGPLDLGIAGAIVAGIGIGAWLAQGRRAVGERCRMLLGDVSADDGLSIAAIILDGATDDMAGAQFVAGDGMTWYHRPGCQMAEGRDWPAASRPEHEALRRSPCGACKP